MSQSGSRLSGFQDRLAGLLDQVALLSAADPRLARLRGDVELGRARSRQPMRVAVVGQIKKGKSTVVNGLLGEAVVPTGVLELTFNVNELLWSPTRTVEVEYKDRPPERRSFADLEALTARDQGRLEELRSIRTIRVGLPNRMLRTFRLLDTPGLNSVYEHDQENALRALGLSRDEIEQASADQLHAADALLFLFSRSLASSSADLLTDLQGPVNRTATPLKAIGVLSKCDDYWLEHGDGGLVERAAYDPLADGRRVCARLMSTPRVARLFYDVLPVCGLLAAGAAALTAEDVDALSALAALPVDRLVKVLSDVGTFATTDDPTLPLPAAQRRRLMTNLGAYGTYVACDRLRAGAGDEELRQALVDASGVGELRSLLVAHFGNRSTVIKADALLRVLQEGIGQARDAGVTGVVDQIADLVQRFRTGEPTFAEFEVLSAYYRRQLGLHADEAAEILAITGERGLSAPERLRSRTGAPPAELGRLCRQRAAIWRQRATSPAEDRARRRASWTITHSYEALADEIEWAGSFLGLADSAGAARGQPPAPRMSADD